MLRDQQHRVEPVDNNNNIDMGGQLGLNGAIMAVVIFITFIIIVAFVMPNIYNANLHATNAHTNYCNMIQQKIDTTKDTDVLRTYITEQSSQCSR